MGAALKYYGLFGGVEVVPAKNLGVRDGGGAEYNPLGKGYPFFEGGYHGAVFYYNFRLIHLGSQTGSRKPHGKRNFWLPIRDPPVKWFSFWDPGSAWRIRENHGKSGRIRYLASRTGR